METCYTGDSCELGKWRPVILVTAVTVLGLVILVTAVS